MRNIKRGISIKLLIILFINIIIISVYSTIQAKYIFQYEFDIANLNIDRTNPKIELLEVTNSGANYENYASKDITVTIKVKITDKNLKEVFLNKEHLNAKIGNENVNDASIKTDKIQDITDGRIYQIKLTKLDGKGVLKIDILEGTAIDTSNLKSELFEIDTNILIYNADELNKTL